MSEKKTREEKMSEIEKRLEIGIREVFEGPFNEFINQMAKFPSYSVNNCILILSQHPTAQRVCSLKTWNKEFNRSVIRGEKGIMILAPVSRKCKTTEEIYDENGNILRNQDGQPVKEEITKEYISFRPVYVFADDQTEGDPLPELVHPLTGSVEHYEELKQAMLDISPVPISFEPIQGAANGYYSPAEDRIVIKEGLPQMQTIKTMLHELSHKMQGHGSKDCLLDRESMEVAAESCCYMSACLLGLPSTDDYSLGYICGWAKTREVTELKECLNIIKKTATELSEQISKRFCEITGLNMEQEIPTRQDIEEPNVAGRRRGRK